nr:putative glucose-6-phosphate 1-epimerase [Tanacetum cinerariifolium]
MGHPAVVSDSKMAIKWMKDSKGIDQIVLRNPRGASAKVVAFFWSAYRGDRSFRDVTIEAMNTCSLVVVKAPKVNRGGIEICFPQVVKAPKVNRGCIAICFP